jgi:hypothetical protein
MCYHKSQAEENPKDKQHGAYSYIQGRKSNMSRYCNNRTTRQEVSLYEKNLCIMVDEPTGTKLSNFYERKAGMVQSTCAELNGWKDSRDGVKYICMDNAGKNVTLQEQSDSSNWKLSYNFKYTAQNEPQKNHLAE